MKKKFLAIILAIVLIATQGSMLFSASAETTYTALTGRDDFVLGVTIRGNNGYAEYKDSYSAIIDAKSLGSSIVRIKNEGLSNKYIKGIADIAAQKDIELMLYDTNIHQYVNGVAVADINIEAIKTYYTELATTLKGKIAYYQVGNEMDIPAKKSGKSGINKSHFNNLDTYAVGIYTAVNAIKAVDPDAKIVVNTSWIDVGFIEGIKSVEIDTVTGTKAVTGTTNPTTYASWDLNGMDWYSNGANEDFRNFEDWSEFGKVLDYNYVIEKLSQWDEDVIVCEAGLWPNGFNEDGSVKYMEDASWLAEFAQYAYEQPKVKGFLAFELYDVAGEPSYHGLISSDKTRKDTFDTLQALYGGIDVARVDTIPAVDTNEMAGEVVNKLYSDVYSFELKNNHRGYTESKNSTNFFTATIDPAYVDVASKSVFEFDMYVEDAKAFVAAGEASEIQLYVWLYGENRTKGRVAQKLSLSNIEKDGWNHIVVGGSQFDDRQGKTEIRESYADEVVIGFQMGSKSEVYDPASGMKVAIANACFTQIADETTSTVGTKVSDFKDSAHKQNRLGKKDGNGATLYSGLAEYAFMSSSANFALSDYVEVDIYIDNYTNFKKSLSEDANGNKVNYGLTFILSSSSSNAFSQQRTYDITNLISHSGWNHIIFQHDSTANGIRSVANNGSTASKIRSATLAYVNYDGTKSDKTYYPRITDTTTVNPAGNDFFAMSTPVVSKLVAPEKDLENKIEVADMEVYKTFKIGSVLSSANTNSATTLGKEFSMAGSEFIEFDFFVNSDEILKDIVSGYFGERLELRLHCEGGYARYNIYSQIKQAGWNHIVIPVKDLYTEKFNRTNAIVTKVQLWFSNGDASHTISSDKKEFIMGMANVITTQAFVAPNKLMSDYTSIGVDKTLELETVDGSFLCELTESVDISSGKMIEFDFYVENASAVTGETIFAFLDSEGQYAPFDIKPQIVSDGWNHIQIDIADFADEDMVDYGAINTWGIINEESGLTGYIANLYAADYVDGDATRDGQFDIKDLVRLKKHIAGIDIAMTNICAVDYDNNYTLQAADCSNMRVELLK